MPLRVSSTFSRAFAVDKVDDTRNGISVSLKQVHFAYPARPDTRVLHGLDIDVKPGQLNEMSP
jgi:ATP-binding cassette subfamily B (MDR/TAP) protein 1